MRLEREHELPARTGIQNPKRTKMPFSSAPASKVYINRVRLFDEALSRSSIV